MSAATLVDQDTILQPIIPDAAWLAYLNRDIRKAPIPAQEITSLPVVPRRYEEASPPQAVALEPVSANTQELLDRLAGRVPKIPFRAQIDLETAQGEPFALDYLQFDVLTSGSQTIVWSNRRQQLFMEIRLTLDRLKRSTAMAFRVNRVPTNAHELFCAIRQQWFLSQGQSVRITDLDTGIELFHAPWRADPDAAVDPAALAFLADLDAIQRKTHQAIPIRPNQPFSEEDHQQIAKLRTILHEGGFTTTWSKHVLNIPASEVRRILALIADDEKQGKLELEGRVTATLFGQVLPLGRARFILVQFRLANEQLVREQLAQATDDTAPITVHLVPGDNATLRADYLDWQPASAVEVTVGPERTTPQRESVDDVTPREDLEPQDRRRQIIAALSGNEFPSAPPPGAWRQMLGVFDNDPIVHEIFEAGRRIREAERTE